VLSEGSLTPHGSQGQAKPGQCADHLLVGTRERLRFSIKIFSTGILKKGFGFGFRVAGAEAVDGGSCGVTRIRIQRHRSGLSIDFCGNWDVNGIHWCGCLAVFRAGAIHIATSLMNLIHIDGGRIASQDNPQRLSLDSYR